MKPNEQLQEPFFARFLEVQHKGNRGAQQNIPGWPFPIPPITSPIKDVEHTLKYPSDGDEDNT